MQNLTLLALISVLLVSGCVQTGIGPSQPLVLDGVEVTEYQGEKLDSLETSFRENSIKGPQYIEIDNYKLEITGLVDNPKSLTYDEVLERQSYEKVVTLYCVEGWDAKILWEGVLAKDLINEAGPQVSANTVIFHAYDGYTTSFPLEYIMDENLNLIMAYKMNGVTLPPERGFPFQLIAESKWGYKWIKWITKIELSDDEDYEGYWESRGYSNTGDLDKSFFGS
jgi:DMSO/TMAO reductase YedYZ molybdopterin-dependent catalytic subunit